MVKLLNGADEHDQRTREMLIMVDQSIAQSEFCWVCGGNVELEITADDQPYESWLVCQNPGCQHRKKVN